jgi:O-antigen ligase
VKVEGGKADGENLRFKSFDIKSLKSEIYRSPFPLPFPLPQIARFVIGALLAWHVGMAIAAPELRAVPGLLAAFVFVITLRRPEAGLTLALALIPAGALLAPASTRVAELLAWAFLAGWLMRIGRPLAESGWPRAIAVPALLYAACAAASWVGLAITNAVGVPPQSVVPFLLTAVAQPYLAFSFPEAHTRVALQVLAGIGLFLAAAARARAQPRLATSVAWAVVGSCALLAVATLVDIGRQWAAAEYGWWFLARYFAGERYSSHLDDLNAAGSLYVLAIGIAAALGVYDRRARWFSVAAIVLMAPAFVLTGSRSALFGLAAGAAAIAFALDGRLLTSTRRHRLAAAACVVALVAVAGVLVAAGGANQPGSAGNAMRLRAQFSETSVRMFASAPLFGVGIGNYLERSYEFMPDEIRELYGAENAHNYYAQAFAELGLIGGAMFLWLVAAGLTAGWRRAAAADRDPASLALFAGCAGYLVTCATGHPFLVAEAALPFWVAFGALVAGAGGLGWPPGYRAVTTIVVVFAVAVLARATVVYARTTEAPAERGFVDEATSPDGTRFRWMGPHVVTYGARQRGFFTMTLRPPDRPLSRPMVVDVTIAGGPAERRVLVPGKWQTVVIPVDQVAFAPFRRIDVRATPVWLDKRRLAQRPSPVDVAVTAMVSEMRWIGPGRR